MINLDDYVFLQNDEWWEKNEEGELILTDKAPKKARINYEKHKKKYLDAINTMSTEEFLNFSEIEDNRWLVFPLDEERKTFSTFKKE